MKAFPVLLLLSISTGFWLEHHTAALPLSTNSRWVVDEGGRRVKLACVSWVSHLETMFAEGLGKQPLDTISKHVASMGFNCVRLTWPLFMVTNSTLASLTVRQSFKSLGLIESVAAIEVNNPSLIGLSVIRAFQEVVSNLGSNKIMVILDNHVSKPGWCCSDYDGNGFFGDRYFDPDLWIKGLTRVATMFKGSSNVVGMSLRNELRGPKQNVGDWYKFMVKGAEAVHTANPDVLVILSGLSFDTDLSFLSSRQVSLTFTGKLVFEQHWYGFSDGTAWVNGNPNDVCGSVVGGVMRRGGFLVDQGWPLFLSEFGVDQRGTNVNDNRYLSCLLSLLADLDLDWSYWPLPGSYYVRDGTLGMDESYGILSWDWSKARNVSFLQRIAALQSPFRGPGVSDLPPYKTLFHPATGLCVLRKSATTQLELGPCTESEAWRYTAQQALTLKGTATLCLQAEGIGKPVLLGAICNESNARWETISDSKLHLSTKLGISSAAACLDVGGGSRSLVTNECKCLSKDPSCEADSQWFKIIDSTREVADRNEVLSLPSEGLDFRLGLDQSV